MTDNRGFSLLEVIIALAFLTGSMAVLGELVHMGVDHARFAGKLTEAELLCESKMAEIVTGISPAETVSDVPFEQFEFTDAGDETLEEHIADWLYSIEMDTLEIEGLTVVRVTVRQDLPPEKKPVKFSLTRWISDDMALDADNEQ